MRQGLLPTENDENRLEGTVDRVVFANAETGFAVLRLAVRAREPVTVVGTLLGLQPGEAVRLQGQWIRDRKYGRQFRAETSEIVRPTSLKGIEKFLSSGLIAGVGEATARKLVEKFGHQTLDVIDREPGRLREIQGLGEQRSLRIAEAWRRQYHLRDIMVFLKTYGVSTALALKIHRRYGDRALGLLRSTPHRLAREVQGIGFKTADRIARDIGVAADAPERLEAGLFHRLGEAADRGHTYLSESQLRADTAQLLEVEPGLLNTAFARLRSAGEMTAIPAPAGFPPGDLWALPHLARAEDQVARRLRRLTAQLTPPLDLKTDRALAWFERQQQIQLAPRQRLALLQALTAKVLVLTGGPGTGKTTLLRGVVAILGRKRQKILLAAPTGRAAKRLAEATGEEAKTLHRLLEYRPEDHLFARNAESPLTADLVVVDEASMLDTTLMAHLLNALPDTARLLLVGDVDQLPSVGPGRVLADLIESGVAPVERLRDIYRQAAQSAIVRSAHRVRDGLMPEFRREPEPGGAGAGREGDFFFIERREPATVLKTLKELVLDRIPNHFGLAPLDSIQILTPMQRGELGAANLNAELQAALNPEGASVVAAGGLLRVGDRVMQRRNNYDLGVFNGDLGRVQGLDLTEQRASIDFDGRIVLYPFADLDELALAYAVSIHKSQGSEYPCVVIPLHTQHFALLQRNLLYTAITRGRKLVVIVGSRRALELAVRHQGSSRRQTLLIERLLGQVATDGPLGG